MEFGIVVFKIELEPKQPQYSLNVTLSRQPLINH